MGVTEGVDPTRAGYDRLAAEYARRLGDELARKPLECQLLDRFAAGSAGRVGDVGCGPGQVARYLHDRGTAVLGFDLSHAMVAEARRLHPALPFAQADMRALPLADGALGGIAAFYSLIHIPRAEMVTTLRELRRAVRPGGRLLAGFHQGRETVHVEALWDVPIDIDFVFFEPREMADYLAGAGFTVEEIIERAPYPEIEAQTRRAYILARRAE
jgi:SAM-dependent methyltransferase